jgi:hypothetical protein
VNVLYQLDRLPAKEQILRHQPVAQEIALPMSVGAEGIVRRPFARERMGGDSNGGPRPRINEGRGDLPVVDDA